MFENGVYNNWLSLFAASLFAFHTANAETVNYIISRSDVYSTFFVVVGFLMYMYWKPAKKYQLFLIPMILGFFTKEPSIMLAPLLFLYVYFFEENGTLRISSLFSSKLKRPFLNLIKSF